MKNELVNVSLDIETWGNTPGSDIRSVGAVVFDPTTNYVAIPSGDENNDSKSFYVATENPLVPDESSREYDDGELVCDYKYPLRREQGTIDWWSLQSAEAQRAFDNPIDLKKGLMDLVIWLNQQCVPETHNLRIWTKGPHFDIAILEEAYRAVGLPHPWHYRAIRDMRTVVELADVPNVDYGELHNALDDAIGQALTINSAIRKILSK